jgi:hypothetical protein
MPNGALDLSGLCTLWGCLSYTPLVATSTRTAVLLPARQVSASVKRHIGGLLAANRRVVAIALLFASASLQQCSNRRIPCPPDLLVLPGAENLDCRRYAGSLQVGYDLAADHPASAAISALNAHLAARGWRQLPEDPLNPGLPTSHVTGWGTFLDGTENPTQVVHQWMADWANDKGDVIRFSLRYQFPKGGPENLRKMHVFGIFVPSELAKSGQPADGPK